MDGSASLFPADITSDALLVQHDRLLRDNSVHAGRVFTVGFSIE